MEPHKRPWKSRPLRIRAYLQTGVISDQFLPIDAIVYATAVRAHLGREDVTYPGQSSVPQGMGIELPFRPVGREGNAWFYKASFAQWPEHTIEDQQNFAKRFDADAAIQYVRGSGPQGDKGLNVDTGRGRYKNYFIKVYYRHALWVDWYVDGDKEALEELLPFCTHIGKKTTQGWGAVLRWEVIEWPDDWSVRGPGEKLMRAVPMQGNRGFLYGIRPSYWLPMHQFNCKMPDNPTFKALTEV